MTTDARRTPRARSVDRWSVMLFSLAALLAVLALLASDLRSAAGRAEQRHVLVRQIIRTRIIETIVDGGRGGTSVSQSVSAPPQGAASYATAPMTRASG